MIKPIGSSIGAHTAKKPVPDAIAPALAAGASPAIASNRPTAVSAERATNFDLSRHELVHAIEAGILDPVNAFGAVAPWPTSATNGRPYHGMNVLTLANRAMEKGYPSGEWCTFEGAKSRGWNVRKGEQHTKVFFFQPVTRETDEVDEQTGDPILKTYPKLMHFKVFNVAQLDTNGKPPTPPKGVMTGEGAAVAARESMERIATNMGFEVTWDPKAKAGSMAGDSITARDVSQLAEVLLPIAMREGTRERRKRATGAPDTPESMAQVEAEQRLTMKIAQAMLSMRLGVEINRSALPPSDIHTALSGGKSVPLRAAGQAEQAVGHLLAFDPELTDELAEERRAMYDEILDAGGDAVVFDAGSLGLDNAEAPGRGNRP
ncbi:ArdC-like ssDNA-binding domain-containing protein [Pseudoxanthomonas kaohsiungensis]|uniref:ArdC-like ssDNA-binding domain-containing protein n=1 Tax=Pseudoxanthomonas kaohsiungensis TaxID=283923 RepID=A0ABW3M0M6_9GAMM|nr:ArdC-like ssDNA-binding domain-containing protein [Pseudoxanthomonas kaohsiungensis]KAF1702924.1 hypothetical protein CSC66_09115 [Pseudoxanthomonas kaohsiungensis]